MTHTSNRGFTLFELLCVLAIIAILSFFGVTRLLVYQQSHQNKQTLQEDINSLSQALQDARQMAITSGVMSFICGGEVCNGRWSTGFELRQQDGYGREYRRVKFKHAVDIHWEGFPANKSRIEFLSNGLSSYQNGTFEFCLEGWHGAIVLNQSGRFYVSDVIKSEATCG